MPEIGSTLREARMRERIDVSEIEAQTKIRAKYLRALENEEWGLLPGPTFVKSFLRTYATALGLDGKALVGGRLAGLHDRRGVDPGGHHRPHNPARDRQLLERPREDRHDQQRQSSGHRQAPQDRHARRGQSNRRRRGTLSITP